MIRYSMIISIGTGTGTGTEVWFSSGSSPYSTLIVHAVAFEACNFVEE